MSDWISIDDRLPAVDGPVLIHAETADENKPLIVIAWYDPGGHGWSLIVPCFIPSITHWMPLPEPPEETR
jgi:hypothetical protein